MTTKYTRFPRAIAAILAALVTLFAMFPVGANAATYTDEIELATRSILLVDRSGSTEGAEKALEKALEASYDAIVYFSSKDLTKNPELKYKGDSPICEAIDAAAEGGFTHITVVTDGEQWPQDYSALGIYSDLDIKIVLTEDTLDAESNALILELQDHVVNSSLEVNFPSGEAQVFLEEYQAPRYMVGFEIPDPVPVEPEGTDGEATTVVQCNHQCTHKCKWWCIWALPVALLALLLALLSLLLWLLSRRARGWKAPVEKRLKDGAFLLLDVSGSMSGYKRQLIRVAQKAGAQEVGAFAEKLQFVEPQELRDLDLGACTYGVEALEGANKAGHRTIVLATDCVFNGLSIEDFSGSFDEVTLLAPDPQATEVQDLAQAMRGFSKRVEVFSLKKGIH